MTAAELRESRDAWWSTELTSALRNKLGAVERQTILDVGCGTGALFRRLMTGDHQPHLLVGIDIDPSRLTGVPKSLAAAAQELPFASGSFSTAVTILTLQHIREPEPVLAEMRRVTRPGGLVLAVEADNLDQRLYLPTDDSGLAHAYSAFWRRLAESAPDTHFSLGPRLLALFNKIGLEECRVDGFLITHCRYAEPATFFAGIRVKLKAFADRYGVGDSEECRAFFTILAQSEASASAQASFYSISTVPLFLVTGRVRLWRETGVSSRVSGASTR